jgi:hypothetical protein
VRSGSVFEGWAAIASWRSGSNSLPGEHSVGLLEHRLQARCARTTVLHPQRPFDTVDDVEPVEQHRPARVAHLPLDLARRALAEVVEVRERPAVAILERPELGAERVAQVLWLGCLLLVRSGRDLPGRCVCVTLG